ncbi:MAG: hypothetical protein MJ108_06525 [Saccharofermentans sp.]|nr:hypothetical protein [Saccharofermentans sp.]
MNFGQNSIFDSYERKAKKDWGNLIAAILCLVVVAMLTATVVWLNIVHKEEETIIPEFILALDEGRYDDALEMYRHTHDMVVAADPESIAEVEEQTEIMGEMESIVNERLISIENLVRTERYVLSNKDLQFMNEMEELTSSQISSWLREICEDFMLGKIQKPDVIFIFDQMIQIGNVSASATPLLQEIEVIEMAAGDVQSAEKDYINLDYISSVQKYTAITNNYEGFVYDFSQDRITEIKEVMYEPMLSAGEHMLDTNKYYSAEELLSDMAVIFPDDSRINNDLYEATSHTTAVTTYRGTVQVIAVRPLIAADDRASGDLGLYLTPSQFSRILEELYNNNYVLVDAETMADQKEPNFITEVDLTVPEGKKPVIIVIEPLDYSVLNYMTGSCSRLILNEQGQICGEYTDAKGQIVVSRHAESIGILDEFVENHPDFSFNGAKGVISICGNESFFGYVVSQEQAETRATNCESIGRTAPKFTDADIETNRATVKTITESLQDNGWRFATSTYGNINAYDSDMETIVNDTSKWMSQIEPLIGDVHIINYPGGHYIYGTDERAEYLKNNGFRIFLGMGTQPYHIYGNNYLYYDRMIVSQTSMGNTDFSELFNVNYVLYGAQDPEPEDNADVPEDGNNN